MNSIKHFLLICIPFILFGCLSTSPCLDLGNGDDVIVNLQVIDNQDLNKIDFHANGILESVSSAQLKKIKTVSFGFDVRGEGMFKICIYVKNDTICSEHYVEEGYRPKLVYYKGKLEVKEHIGYGY
ncbi:hypothetical protein J4050_07350 [Winogradskyella sp. DF17]|uniref:Lipoprotein n=1 Tax=Winogradskyella pelagia TaxID=2819984 RepID=A0ABS3T1D3_9FLAO|nr:hypothetical protein [Winogradskyella sp. DF17]MBO3116556.1 hypothetical protein [Winogradskyella sp. DF17]